MLVTKYGKGLMRKNQKHSKPYEEIAEESWELSLENPNEAFKEGRH